MNKQPSNYEPGIYFGLQNEAYHADGALSNSGAKMLLRDGPLAYWYASKAFNKNAINRQTKAMAASDRFHMLLLEPERFDRLYAVQPGGGPLDNRSVVSRIEYDEMQQAIRLINGMPKVSQLFKGGASEVSIFWPCPRTGLMLRCRPDYLKPTICNDYKAHAEVNNKSVRFDIVKYGYDVQAAMYVDGITAIKRLLRNGEATVYGDHDEAWLDQFLATDDMRFVFTFQRKEPPYIIKTLEVADDIIEIGRQKMESAIDTYSECLRNYGTEPWPPGKDEIDLITLDDLPAGIFYNQRGINA